MDGNNFGYLIPHFNWLPATVEYSQVKSMVPIIGVGDEEGRQQMRRLEKKIKDL